MEEVHSKKEKRLNRETSDLIHELAGLYLKLTKKKITDEEFDEKKNSLMIIESNNIIKDIYGEQLDVNRPDNKRKPLLNTFIFTRIKM